jgi:S1-C subfamily serine protease
MCQDCIGHGGEPIHPAFVLDPMTLLPLLLAVASAAQFAFWRAVEEEDPSLRQASLACVSFEGGSGFVVSPDGHVITANHVATMLGETPWVRLGWTDSPGPAPVQLHLVAVDANADLALYRLPAGRYDAIPISPEPTRAGARVTVVAHPPRRPLLYSEGLVLEAPALWAGQPILEYTAPAYDGYSGGALLDEQGRAVGVHRGWDYRDLGHGHLVAVPAAEVARLLEQAGAADQTP